MENDNRNTERITDLSYLGTICDGDQAFKREMIETFLNNTPSLINDMKLNLIMYRYHPFPEISNHEFEELNRICHVVYPNYNRELRAYLNTILLT